MVLSFTEAATQAVRGTACALLAASDEATAWINTAIGKDEDYGNIANGLRKLVCNESGPDDDYGPEVPFTGGQCDNVLYDVQTWRRFKTNAPVAATITNVPGPIIDFRCYAASEVATSSQRVVGIETANEPSSAAEQLVNGNWLRAVESGGGTLCGSDYLTRIDGITRADGQPDDCGDPPGEEVPPFVPTPTTVNITYEDNSETTINEDIDITLGPVIVGIGGILYAPVTIGTGDITLNGTVELAPNFSVELFPNGLFGGGGNTDGPAPSPSVDDPEPEVPGDRRRIIGAIVTVTNFSEDIARVTQVAQGESPDIFIPRTGNISFYIDTPGGQAWTEPTPLRNVRQYVPCPAREGAVDVAVTSGTGFALDVTPVYADLALA